MMEMDVSNGMGVMQEDTISILNLISELERVYTFIEEVASRYSIVERVRYKLHLAIDEILANIISYAYTDDDSHYIIIRFWIEDETVRIEFVDDGVAYNPLLQPEPKIDVPLEERQIGGLGIYLVRKLMDTVEYRRDSEKNHLVISKSLHGANE